jgi:acetate CoA/acetoacetate CoA-transferase beta subunit
MIARRAAKELRNGDVVNLGIGLPTLVADYLPEGVHIVLESENGIVGMGPTPEHGGDPLVTNAGGGLVTLMPGGCFIDSAMSFTIIRGGHVHIAILGTLEVDAAGNIASWTIPGKMMAGMGGSMDLVVGAKRVVVTTEHTNKGRPKILKCCKLPLTAAACANTIITEMGVMDVTDRGLVLTEYNPEYTLDEIRAATEAELIVSEDLKQMEIAG